MYVDEKDGVFTLCSTHQRRFNVEKKVDIIRPEGYVDNVQAIIRTQHDRPMSQFPTCIYIVMETYVRKPVLFN